MGFFVNHTETIKFKAKGSEIAATPLCPGKISKDFLVDNMKKTRLNVDMFMIMIMMLLQLMIY